MQQMNVTVSHSLYLSILHVYLLLILYYYWCYFPGISHSDGVCVPAGWSTTEIHGRWLSYTSCYSCDPMWPHVNLMWPHVNFMWPHVNLMWSYLCDHQLNLLAISMWSLPDPCVILLWDLVTISDPHVIHMWSTCNLHVMFLCPLGKSTIIIRVYMKCFASYIPHWQNVQLCFWPVATLIWDEFTKVASFLNAVLYQSHPPGLPHNDFLDVWSLFYWWEEPFCAVVLW